MLKRIYINNFRSFVNFEAEFATMNILMGPNGSGKSTIFDVLSRIQSFVVKKKSIGDTFSPADITRWQDSNEMDFELTLSDSGCTYDYKLSIEFYSDKNMSRMKSEQLHCDGKPLFKFDAADGDAIIYGELDGQLKVKYPLDWSQSGVGSRIERHDNRKTIAFQGLLSRMFIFRINPYLMCHESRTESFFPDVDLSNFASWYRNLVQERQDQVFDLIAKLRATIPGFQSLSLHPAGEAKLLKVNFSSGKKKATYNLHELSDGQRALIALYTILYCAPQNGFLLCVDEPENYLALPEIQPWIDELYDVSENKDGQFILISHHPSIINLLGSESGIWVDQDGACKPTRARKIDLTTSGESMSIAELVRRNWIYAN